MRLSRETEEVIKHTQLVLQLGLGIRLGLGLGLLLGIFKQFNWHRGPSWARVGTTFTLYSIRFDTYCIKYHVSSISKSKSDFGCENPSRALTQNGLTPNYTLCAYILKKIVMCAQSVKQNMHRLLTRSRHQNQWTGDKNV